MRVFLTNLPPLLKDILSEALSGESDIAVVDSAGSPDIVLVQANREEAERIRRERGGVIVFAIDPQGTHGLLLGAGEEPVVLADVSPTTIIMAIRGTA